MLLYNNLKLTTRIKDFVMGGIQYTKESGTVKLIKIDTHYSRVIFNNGVEHDINVHNQCISALMNHGTFVKGIYDKECILIKEDSYLLLVPIDSEDYEVLSSFKLKKINLIEGFVYKVKNSRHFSFNGKYLGELFKYSINGGMLESAHIFFDIEENCYRTFFNKKDLLLEDLLDNSIFKEPDDEDIFDMIRNCQLIVSIDSSFFYSFNKNLRFSRAEAIEKVNFQSSVYFARVLN